MEAVAAFSLAANIVPFIDATSKLISLLWNLYFSSKEGLEEYTALVKLTQDLHNVLENLRTTEGGDGMQQIVEECQMLGSEMESTLRKLILSDKIRKRDALKAAVKLLWKEDEIKAIQTKLDAFRSQLTLHLITSLRSATQGFPGKVAIR